MANVYIDVGIKNFFYVVVQGKQIMDFNVIKFKSTDAEKLMKELSKFIEHVCVEHVCVKHICAGGCWYIESQLTFNSKCTKIETILKTLLFAKGLKFKTVRPATKYKVLDPEMSNKSYTIRKKWVVTKGTELLSQFEISAALRERFDGLDKKDDFCDCILMAVTET
jgi:hypothetical protein